jgi:phytoene synthase
MHFSEAHKVMIRAPRKTVRAPRIMGEVYRTILDLLAARGFAAPRQPVRVPRTRLAWILLRYGIV